MAADDAKAIGKRIKQFRVEKQLTGVQLADRANVSRSYLSELENGAGNHKRPSADLLYRIGKALGVTMSELLGRPLILEQPTRRLPGLEKFAREHKLSRSDVDMLTGIKFRGEPPRTPERWEFIYNAIKNSQAMDERRRR